MKTITIPEIEKYIKDGVKFMQENNDYTLYKYNLDDKYVIAMYWAEGFDPEDQATLILDESNNGLVVGIKLRNDSEWDGNYLDFPIDEENGNLLVEESAISKDENEYSLLAKYLLDDYTMLVENDTTEVDESLLESFNKTKVEENKLIEKLDTSVLPTVEYDYDKKTKSTVLTKKELADWEW